MMRVAVVGAGVMGSLHARVLNSMSNCELVAVIDPDESRGKAVADSFGVGFSKSIAELPHGIDAAVVATPSDVHEETALPLLRSGIDLLVEKPLAHSVESAKRIIEVAEEQQRLLMVGHVERFNPAVIELRQFIEQPVHLRFSRIGPFAPRVATDVVLDLMVHDLDLAFYLTGSKLTEVRAVGHCVRTDVHDIVSALLTFESGVTASLTASRIGQNKIREIAITQIRNSINVDLLRQDVTIHRIHDHEFVNEGASLYRQSGIVEIPFLETRGEPLALELTHFLECVGRGENPTVTGADGLRALEATLAVQQCLEDVGSGRAA